jgi:hypothetical protein
MRQHVTLLLSVGLLPTYKRRTALERPIKAAVQPERFKAMQDSRGAIGRNDRPGPSIHRGRLARSFARPFILQNPSTLFSSVELATCLLTDHICYS